MERRVENPPLEGHEVRLRGLHPGIGAAGNVLRAGGSDALVNIRTCTFAPRTFALALTEDLAVYTAAERATEEGRPVVLATIVRCRGSTPRGCGSKMLVDPERGLTGTVGGGCGEGEVIEAARAVLETGAPRLLRIDLTEDLFSWSPAVCGGTFDVFLERVDPAPTGSRAARGRAAGIPSTTPEGSA